MTSTRNRRHAVVLVNQARRDGARLASACRELGIGMNTYRRWASGDVDRRPMAPRPAPANKLSPDERAEILHQCHRSAHASLPPSQIVPHLLDTEGRYIASESSFYRVLREAGEQQRRGRAAARRNPGPPRRHPAQAPNTLWSWDVTYLPSRVRGRFFYLYFIIDIYSRKIVGFEVFDTENADNSRQVLQKAVWREAITHRPLILHSDNGRAMTGATVQATLQALGITPSRSRPGVSNDNAYSEALFKTCKYRPGYPPAGFADLKNAQQWALDFVRWYNEDHRHSAIRFVTPAQRHTGQDRAILAERDRIYRQAQQDNPKRWTGATRNWTPVQRVWLNPERPLEAA